MEPLARVVGLAYQLTIDVGGKLGTNETYPDPVVPVTVVVPAVPVMSRRSGGDEELRQVLAEQAENVGGEADRAYRQNVSAALHR